MPRTPDPPFVARFSFAVDGLEVGAFTEVTGLEVTMEPYVINEGGNNGGGIAMPGRLKWPNLVLKRGVTRDNALFDWFSACTGEGLDGAGHQLERRSGSVTLLDSLQKPFRTWHFRDAIPVRWIGPQLGAGGNGLATEQLEVSHGGFTAS